MKKISDKLKIVLVIAACLVITMLYVMVDSFFVKDSPIYQSSKVFYNTQICRGSKIHEHEDDDCIIKLYNWNYKESDNSTVFCFEEEHRRSTSTTEKGFSEILSIEFATPIKTKKYDIDDPNLRIIYLRNDGKTLWGFESVKPLGYLQIRSIGKKGIVAEFDISLTAFGVQRDENDKYTISKGSASYGGKVILKVKKRPPEEQIISREFVKEKKLDIEPAHPRDR